MDQSIKNALENNQWGEVVKLINEKPKLDNELLSTLGWALSRLGKYDEAIDCFEKLIKEDPNSAKWHYMKGYQFYMQKNYENAVNEFLLALDLYPQYLVVKYRLAYSYLQIAGAYLKFTKDTFWKALGQLKECHKIYEKYSTDQQEKEKSTYFDICFLHGKTIQDMNGKQKESLILLKRALSIKDDEDCKYELSKTYFIAKELDKALECLPNSSKFYVKELKANILSEQKKFENSNSILLSLIKQRKKDYLFAKLADNYVQLGEIIEALNYAKLAVSYGKNNYKNYLILGTIYFKNGRYKTAINNLVKANDIKVKMFKISCPEANQLIFKINELTANHPSDSCSTKCNIGIIEYYNDKKGYGFINDHANGKIFFHITEIEDFGKNKVQSGIKVS